MKAIINYMKEIISLLGFQERVNNWPGQVPLPLCGPEYWLIIQLSWGLRTNPLDSRWLDSWPRSWRWWPIQSIGTVKAKIILGKVKQTRKTLFKTIAIGEGDNAVYNQLLWRIRGRRVFKHWAFSQWEKCWRSFGGRLINVMDELTHSLLISSMFFSVIRPFVFADWHPAKWGCYRPP